MQVFKTTEENIKGEGGHGINIGKKRHGQIPPLRSTGNIKQELYKRLIKVLWAMINLANYSDFYSTTPVDLKI